MFPITDMRGRVISFGGRALDPEAKAKYLNGPETDLFNKSQVLYGLYDARKILGAGDADAPLVTVEGYMDVVACQRAGVAAVAGMGTALTEEQMALMWRFHAEPTLCFDGDGAGQRAVGRAIERALPQLKPGKSFKFAIVTGGKDPDDVLREQGAAALKAQLSQTTPFVDALFTLQKDMEPLDTPERRAAFKGRLRTAAASIQDKDLSQAYREELLTRYDAMFARPAQSQGQGDRQFPQRRRTFNGRGEDRFVDRGPPTAEGMAAARRLADGLDPMAAALAKAALDDPGRLDERLEALEVHGLGHPALNDLASEIIRLRLSADVLDSEGLTRHLTTRGYGALLSEIDRAARISGAPFLNSDLSLESARALWSHAFEVLIRMAALETALSTAKAELTESSDTTAFMRLKGERDALKRAIRTGTVWTDTGSIG
jgi:DNA primase